MFCSGDVGWITGHNYAVYTPLALGITTVIFEGVPSFPDYDRLWQILDRTKATHFYTAPTTLRMVRKERPKGKVMNTDRLRVIASIGEPLAPNVWLWSYEVLGQKQVHVLDTYFQTEMGYHAFSPLAGITPVKPGSVALPFFGFDPALIDPVSGQEVETGRAHGILAFKQSWPSITRTVWGDHARYMNTYLEAYRGYFMTGDSAERDQDGYYRILGRVDDVVNVSGHRLSTGEIEAALLAHGAFAEVAVADVDEAGLRTSAITHVGSTIGRFAIPKQIFFVSDLPKTRSGKIMRRLLKKVLEEIMTDIIAELENQGMTPASTLANVQPPNQPSINIPYPFESYNLTALDNILPPCHMCMLLALDDASLEGIDVLKGGAERLCQNFPFLTGVVVPSSQAARQRGVFEVQPANSSFMEQYPMVQIGYGPEMDDISPDDFIEQKYLPIPYMMPPTEPLPLIRFKANVTKNRIILCIVYYHTALDSTSVSVTLKALAELCKDSELSPDLLPSSARAEQSSRHHTANPTAGDPLPLNWTLVPLSLDPKLPDDPGKLATSRGSSLSYDKVTLLKDTCNAVLAALPPIDGMAKPPLLTSNDILMALVGICGNKAPGWPLQHGLVVTAPDNRT
ncbi:hypothetical protein BJX61DRAFT_547942 [Aspergillus egyptiacus]|nr:hypothetical protein BJX61DRAFT_547942 [Aspergillus egyptiacus]